MATYYVDFVGGADTNNGTSTATPWKRVRGMTGVTGVAAAATIAGGDTIVFKGGVTWTACYPWVPVGGSSSMVTYTVDLSWFTGASWSQPVFDQQGAGTHYAVNALMNKTGGGYLTFNRLQFYRCGVLGAVTDAACAYFINCHHLTFTNCLFDTRTWFAIYFNGNNGGDLTDFFVTDCEGVNTTALVWIASINGNTRFANLQVLRNTLHDGASMIGG